MWGVEIAILPLTIIACTTACCYRTSHDVTCTSQGAFCILIIVLVTSLMEHLICCRAAFSRILPAQFIRKTS